MNRSDNYRIIIGGGGTGGHIFPAISIANALKQRLVNVTFLFVGALGKIEMEKVPEAGYDIVGLPVAGFQRRVTVQNLTFVLKLLRSMQLSAQLIRKFKPDLAIGVGGYASGPIVKAAARQGIPVLLQEQNSYAGVTNRLLAKSASKICVAYEGMEKYFPEEKIVLTGNPVRQDLLLNPENKPYALKHFGLQGSKKVLLLIGGSLGARTLNESIVSHIALLAKSDLHLIWQCGNYYYQQAKKKLDESGANNVTLLPFIKEMNLAFLAADLIISRAGAGTISELCLVGKPAILVPSPNVAEDHQTRNALSLTTRNAAVFVADKDAENELVEIALSLINDAPRCRTLSDNIKKLAIPDSSDRIVNEVKNILDIK